MVTRREAVYIQIDEERNRQDTKFGEQNHEVFRWATILGEEFGEACKEVMDLHLVDDDPSRWALKRELVQVGAVVVAWLECLERNA